MVRTKFSPGGKNLWTDGDIFKILKLCMNEKIALRLQSDDKIIAHVFKMFSLILLSNLFWRKSKTYSNLF